MFVTMELLRDKQNNHQFAIDGIRLGNSKPIGIAQTVWKGDVLISDLVKTIGKENILEYTNKKEPIERACAFDESRECDNTCVAMGRREKGCAGEHEWCERGNFWIGGK